MANIEYLEKRWQQKVADKKWQEALEISQQLIGLETNTEKKAILYASEGALFYQLGELQKALSSYQNAVQLDPQLDIQKDINHVRKELFMDQPTQKRVLQSKGAIKCPFCHHGLADKVKQIPNRCPKCFNEDRTIIFELNLKK